MGSAMSNLFPVNESGYIQDARVSTNREGIDVLGVGIYFPNAGNSQGYQRALPVQGQAVDIVSVLRVFGVDRLQDLVGKSCQVRRNGQLIEASGNLEGTRWTTGTGSVAYHALERQARSARGEI